MSKSYNLGCENIFNKAFKDNMLFNFNKGKG